MKMTFYSALAFILDVSQTCSDIFGLAVDALSNEDSAEKGENLKESKRIFRQEFV